MCVFWAYFYGGHSIIAYNGDFIIEPDTRKILSKEAFNRTQTEEVMDVMRQNNLSPLVYSFVVGLRGSRGLRERKMKESKAIWIPEKVIKDFVR